MPISFPANPALNQTYTFNSITWTWNGNLWTKASTVSSGVGGATVTVANTAPTSPTEGALWVDSDYGDLNAYFSNAWAIVGGGGSLNVSNLTLSQITADMGNLSIAGNVTVTNRLSVTSNIVSAGSILANSIGSLGSSITFLNSVTTTANPAFMAGIAATSNTTYTANPYAFNFNVTAFNRGNHFNTTNSRFTAPVGGVYLFGFCLYMASGSNPYTQFIFRKNGADPPSFASGDAYGVVMYPAGSNNTGYTLSSMLELAAGDYVTVGVRSGSSGTFYQGHTYFFGYLVG